MSTEFMEYCPDEPEFEDETQYSLVYLEYFEGLIFRDLEKIRYGGNTIYSFDYPKSTSVWHDSRIVEDALLSEDEERKQNIIRTAFVTSLRSYIYSGLDIDTENIHLVTALLGQDKKWLRSMIEPEPDVIYEVAGTDDVIDDDYKDFKYYGQRALLRLGLAPAWQRVFLKLRNIS
jgi:hypothetical protein